MRAPESVARSGLRHALLLAVLALSAGARAEDEETGWSPEHFAPQEAWREQSFELPDYPATERLIEIEVPTGSFPYDVLVDSGSLERGSDGVVRYSVVVRSRGGAENVAFEGILCRDRAFRRYAYGYDRTWKPIEGSDWEPIKPGGMGHYRFVLYRDYLCDPVRPALKVSEMIQRMRYSQGAALDD
jgi:hypothetical protein